MNSLPMEEGVLSLRCELRGTNCEAHITLISRKDTVTLINKMGKDGLTKLLESVKSAKLFPAGIDLYERKWLRGTPKDFLLGVQGRLQEGLRAKLELQPYAEGHCHGGIVHASQIVFIPLIKDGYWPRAQIGEWHKCFNGALTHFISIFTFFWCFLAAFWHF